MQHQVARSQYEIFLDIDTLQLAKQYAKDLDRLVQSLKEIDQGTGVAHSCLFPTLWYAKFYDAEHTDRLGVPVIILARHVSTLLSQNIAKASIRTIFSHLKMPEIDFNVMFLLDHLQFHVFEYSHLMSLHGMLFFIQKVQIRDNTQIIHVSSYHVDNDDLSGISSRPFNTRRDPVYFPDLKIYPTREGVCPDSMVVISDVSNSLFEFKTCGVCQDGQYFDKTVQACKGCQGERGTWPGTYPYFSLNCSFTTDNELRNCHDIDEILCQVLDTNTSYRLT